MLARKALPFATSLLLLLAACSSGTGEEPGAARPDEEEDGGSGGKGGKAGTGGKAGSATKGGSGGTVSAGGKAGSGDVEEGGTGGTGGSAGTGGKGGASGAAGKGGASGSGGASGNAGGVGGTGGASGKSGAGGAGTAGAGGTSAGGTNAGGSGTGGTNAGGTSAGGSGGAPACVPSAPAEVCYNGKDDNCDGAQDEACPPLSLEGNWRWTFTFEGAPRRTTLAMVGGANLAGNAMDEYGLATLTGTFTAATKAFSFTKKYDDGGTFIYAGTATFTPAGVTVAGKWRQENLTTETAFSGVLQDERAVSNAAGAWKIDAYFDPTVTCNLSLSPQGYVTGTMSDDDGASTLTGMFDRGDGRLFVRKVYGGTGTTLWWQGNVAANGQNITGGTIGDDPATFDYGSWTGQR